MNILSYIHPIRTYLPCSGAGRVINNMIRGLAEKDGFDVSLLVSRQWIGPDGKLDKRAPLRDLLTRTFPYPENRTERLWKTIGVPSMDRFVPEKTDWLYAPVDTCIPVRKCPVAITFYDMYHFEKNIPWKSGVQQMVARYKRSVWTRKAVRKARLVFTISEFSKARLCDIHGVPPEKVVVHHCGVEELFFNIRDQHVPRQALPCSGPYVIVVGGLRKKKGAEYVLAAARVLQKTIPELSIVIAGEQEQHYFKTAESLPNIVMLDMVDDESLARYLRGAVCLLFLSHYEGFGLPAAEAMAAGVPAIVSNNASLPEVVGEAGIIVQPAKTETVVSTIARLLDDHNYREYIVAAGRRQAESFRWSRCVDIAAQAFTDLIH